MAIDWPSDKELCTLYYDEEYTLNEIAGGLGCSIRAVQHVLKNIEKCGSGTVERAKPVTKKTASIDDRRFMQIIDACTTVNYAKACELIGISKNQRGYAEIRKRLAKIRKNGI